VRRRARIPALLYLIALALLVVAMARPVALIALPTNRAALVLAIDTSQSMMADDVKPSRIEAAKQAALILARSLPRSLQIGLVAFSDVGAVLLAPTTDRLPLTEALERLHPQQSTAVGSAVVEGLAILPRRREFLGERLARLRAQAAPDPLSGVPYRIDNSHSGCIAK
jgi:Ca-activated chloride channel family protein